jgi:O-acetyl-ADP-ribose deacetylase (regulator of RNase III)
MMVKGLVGDLFESKCQTLVNTVNTVGIMGKGIALEFKKRFPDMFEDYVKRCAEGKVKLGEPYLYKRLTPPWILNFPTKEHWRSVSNISDIVGGLNYLEQHYKKWGVTSIALPPLGCGHGQLEWKIVGPTLYRNMKKLDIPVELYAPLGTPPEELTPEFLLREVEQAVVSGASINNKIESGLIAIVEVLARIEKEPYKLRDSRCNFHHELIRHCMRGQALVITDLIFYPNLDHPVFNLLNLIPYLCSTFEFKLLCSLFHLRLKPF